MYPSDAAGARRRAAVAGRLIEYAVAVRGLGERGGVGVLRHFEGAPHASGGGLVARKRCVISFNRRPILTGSSAK